MLLSATPTLGTDGTIIDLVFDTAMAAGSGAIVITDGAVQTVIDRATGQPTMRVVGANDTHTVSAASVSIDGTHVKLNVAGLLPGHQYSIVMGSGVLVSINNVAFGGVRSTSQLQFSAPVNPDQEGPSFVSASADAALLKAGGSLKVTLTFSEIVSGLTADALNAPNATVSALTATGDGHTWVATLTPSGALEQAGNALTIDMGKVHDTVGNAGAGVGNVASYAVDTRPPTGIAIAYDGAVLKAGASVGLTFTFSEAVKNFSAAAITAPHAAIGNLASLDDGHTWTATLIALDPSTSSGNKLSVDMSKLQDLNGNAGSGSFVSGASYAVDTAGPEAPAIRLQGGLVSANDSVQVVLTFKEQVSLDTDAVVAPNATVQGLHTIDGGLTWQATLRPGAAAEASANTLAIDMSKVHDAAGNAGSGSPAAADPYAVDSKGPTATIALDGTDLKYGAAIVATIALSDFVGEAALRDALALPNARIDTLSTADDGKTWKVTLVADGSAVAATNALSLDLTKLHDAHGNAGSATVQSANYAADNAVSVHVEPTILIDDSNDGPISGDYVTNQAHQTISFDLSAPLGVGQHIEIAIDHQLVSSDGLTHDNTTTYWSLSGSATDLADGVHTFEARVVDSAGHGSATVSQAFTIDTGAPTLEHWPEGAIVIGAPDALELKFDEAVYFPTEGIASIEFIDANGASTRLELNDSFLSEDRTTLTIRADQHHLQAGQNYHFVLPALLTDLAGNRVPYDIPLNLQIASGDLQAPSATSATTRIETGIHGLHSELGFAVAFDEAVKVAGSGSPVLNLSNGGVAVFDKVSDDGLTMFFKYTVGASNEADSGDLQLNGSAGLVGHVSDLAGNMLDLAHIHFSSLVNTSGAIGPIQIDAHASPAPGAPLLAAISDTGTIGDALTNLAKPSLAGGDTASFATVKLYEGGTLLASTVSDTDGHWSIAAGDWASGQQLGDGAHTLTVRQYDAANNESAASDALTLSVDTVAPNKPGAPILAIASDTGALGDGLTGDATPTLSGVAAEAGGKIELYLNGGATALASADVGAGGAWSLTVPDALALADGVASLTVRQVDAAGNRGASSDALALTVDKTAPAVLSRAVLDAASDSGVSASDGITNIKTPKLLGTALGAGTVEIYDGTTLIGTTEVQGDNTWSFTVGSQPARLAQFADGMHNLTVRQVDTAGNRSAASEVLNVTIDTVGPSLKTSALEWDSSKQRFELKFDEQIVFVANAAIDVLNTSSLLYSHHTGNVHTNWTLATDDHGVTSELELNLSTLFGLFGQFYLKADTSAIQDLAGNVAVIGTPSFSVLTL
jgi:hypothetical protein